MRMSPPDLEINLLRAFVTVADTGSFTAAAAILGRSQSAVSQKVQRLEQVIGKPVFARNSRALALTPAGERLLVAARGMLDASDRLMRSLRQPAHKGLLRLGICEDFLPGQLPRLLSRFARLYDGVEIDLATGLSCKLIADYEDGCFDAIIVKRDFPGRTGRVIWREPLAWMAAAGYDQDREDPARLVMLPSPCSYRDLMVRMLGDAGRKWIASCTASSLTGAQAAVAGGLGVTVLGRSFLREDMKLLTDTGLWPALPEMELIVVGAQAHTFELVDTLVDFLTDRFPRPASPQPSS